MSNILSNIYKQGETVVSELQTMNRAMQLMGDKDSAALRQEDKHRKYEREQDKREKQSRDKLHHDIKNNVTDVASKTKKGEGTKSLSTGLASVIAGSVKAEEKKHKQQNQQQTPKDGEGGGARSISMYGAPDDAPTDTKPKVSHVDRNQNPPPKILGPIGNDNQELEARIEQLEREIFSFESTKVTFTRPEGESKPNVKKFQVGGFTGAVPHFGQPSTGDHFYTSVDPGTYILNRNAVANMGFQSGGIPVALEKGEVALPPGSYDQGMMDFLNYDAFPRFQSGGIVAADHEHTGPGWSVGPDANGRPSTLSRGAAEALQKMIQASKGVVKTSDIASAKRSPKHNAYVGGVENSNHLTGNAIDIHGASKAWMKKHGEKYGFRLLVYPGHDGHFDYIGAPAAAPDGITPERTTPVNEGPESTASTTGSEGGGNENIEPMTPEDIAKSTIEEGGGGIVAGVSGFLAGAFAMLGKELGVPGSEVAGILSGGGGGGGPMGGVLSGGFGTLADQVFGGVSAAAGAATSAATSAVSGATGGARGTPSAVSVKDPNARALLDAIAVAEGTTRYPNNGYYTQFTGRQFKGNKHPRQVISGGGHRSDAAGRYQFLSTTWDEYAKGRDMSPANQDAVALDLVRIKRKVDISDGLSMQEIYRLGQEWASIEGGRHGVPGGSYGGQAKYSAKKFMKLYQSKGGKMQKRQAGGTVGNLMGMPSADTMNFFEQTSTQGMRQAQRGGVNVITLGGEGGGEGEPGLTTTSSGNNLPMFDIPIRDNCPLSIYYRFEPSFNPSGMGAR